VTYELTRASRYGSKAAFRFEGAASSALEVPESSTSVLFLLFFGETAGGGDCADVVASEAASFSEDPADFREPAGSFSKEGASWLSSVTTARSSTSPPSGRGGSETRSGWFYTKTKGGVNKRVM
jgi:hypothetical protein